MQCKGVILPQNIQMYTEVVFMRRYRKFLSLLAEAEAYVSAFVLAVMVSINFMEIISRYIFKHSFMWVQELSVFLVCWLVYLGSAYVYCSSELLRVDFLYSKTKGAARLVWNIVVHTIILAVLMALIIHGWRFSGVQAASRSSILHIPNNFLSLPLSVCSCTMLLKWVDRVALFVEEYRGTQKGVSA